jgi:hypothetical protein
MVQQYTIRKQRQAPDAVQLHGAPDRLSIAARGPGQKKKRAIRG